MQYLILFTFLLSPAYIIRFNLFGFSTNLLMLWVFLSWIIFFVWLIFKKNLGQFFFIIKNISLPILIFTGLFLLAGFLSLFINGFDTKKIGVFIVLFLQPISIFFIGNFLSCRNPKLKPFLLSTFYFLLAFSGLYAILQYFTLIGLPVAWWGNTEEPKRALSFFAHPNFYALWSAPLLAFLIPDVTARAKHTGLRAKWPIFFWAVGSTGLLLSLSRSGWLGLGIAILIYFFVAADKKNRQWIFISTIVLFIIIFSVPNFRFRVLLPFYGEKSAVSRLSLWQTGIKGIKENPIFGLGLLGFSRQWPILNTDPGLAAASHNYPHNIFLDLWVELGILGLISFIGIVSYYIYQGLKNSLASALVVSQSIGSKTANESANYKLANALFLIALLFSGLLDNPYFKNDLAMVFWLVLSLV